MQLLGGQGEGIGFNPDYDELRLTKEAFDALRGYHVTVMNALATKLHTIVETSRARTLRTFHVIQLLRDVLPHAHAAREFIEATFMKPAEVSALHGFWEDMGKPATGEQGGGRSGTAARR